MNNKIGYVLAFVLGAGVGVLATRQYFKTKYERIADEDIASVKEEFSKRKPAVYKKKEVETPKINKKVETREYMDVLKREGYTDYTTPVKQEQNVNISEDDEPYVIAPEAYGIFEDYDTVELTYYSDGVLADDNDDVIPDPEELVGADIADKFGEYEDDVVHIRNPRLKCDYEVLLDLRRYSDVVDTSTPSETED